MERGITALVTLHFTQIVPPSPVARCTWFAYIVNALLRLALLSTLKCGTMRM